MSNSWPTRIVAQPGVTEVRIEPSGVAGVEIYRFPLIRDPHGDLTVGEYGRGFPFQPKRYFIVSRVPRGERRGVHAHKCCHQLLICAQGSCTALVDDGTTRREFILDNSSVGLHVGPMIWGTQHDYSADGTLLVFASDYYDPDDYIRDYDAFQDALRGRR
jgi:UDP-2-acetamido-3-amino-2,3-dideoxy-glucuronate N-acetyltransferase